jgi:translation initiation factor IF-1
VIARAAVAVLFGVAAPALAGAGPSRPAVALTATPAHVTLVGAGRQVIRVANRGSEPLVVDVAATGLTLGPRGAPRILLRGAAARRAATWLRIRPARIVLRGGMSAELGVAWVPPRAATPGDHAALVLLTTRARPGAPVGVRLRIGITVVVHVPGRTRHALVVRALHVRARRHVLQLVVANTGNVIEMLRNGAIEVSLVAQGRVVARLRSSARELLPHSTGVIELRYRGDVSARVSAHVVLRPPAGAVVRRTFRLIRNE